MFSLSLATYLSVYPGLLLLPVLLLLRQARLATEALNPAAKEASNRSNILDVSGHRVIHKSQALKSFVQLFTGTSILSGVAIYVGSLVALFLASYGSLSLLTVIALGVDHCVAG